VVAWCAFRQAFGVTRWRAIAATAVWVILLGGVLAIGGLVATQLATESVPTYTRSAGGG
jgi:hypothetical protein